MEKKLVYGMRAETRKQSIVSLELSSKAAPWPIQVFAALLMFTYDHKSTTDIDFGITDKFQ